MELNVFTQKLRKSINLKSKDIKEELDGMSIELYCESELSYQTLLKYRDKKHQINLMDKRKAFLRVDVFKDGTNADIEEDDDFTCCFDNTDRVICLSRKFDLDDYRDDEKIDELANEIVDEITSELRSIRLSKMYRLGMAIKNYESDLGHYEIYRSFSNRKVLRLIDKSMNTIIEPIHIAILELEDECLIRSKIDMNGLSDDILKRTGIYVLGEQKAKAGFFTSSAFEPEPITIFGFSTKFEDEDSITQHLKRLDKLIKFYFDID